MMKVTVLSSRMRVTGQVAQGYTVHQTLSGRMRVTGQVAQGYTVQSSRVLYVH
jgi:hypothetical protein